MTLSREFMGMAALAILWLNTLLVVAATLRPLLASLGRARRFRRQGIIAKTVDTIAEHRIEQVARRVQAAGRQAILWHDRNYGSVVLSGEIERGDERFELVPCEGVEAEVWVSPARIKANAACPSLQSFDDAYKQAKGAKGYRRILRTAVDAGQRVWVCGNIKDGKLYGSETAPLWVSTQCPLAWRRRHLVLWLLFSLITVAVACAISFLVLQPPWFGRLGTLGGALGLVYFLLVQPAGVAFRDATLPPNRAAVGGRWLAPKP